MVLLIVLVMARVLDRHLVVERDLAGDQQVAWVPTRAVELIVA